MYDCNNVRMGQNLASSWSSTGTYDAAAHVTPWVNEKTNYDYTYSNTCAGVCGHYTQVVWDDLIKVPTMYTVHK